MEKRKTLLLYRKENSELDSYCRHNVYLSRLYISRMKEEIHHISANSLNLLAMYRNLNLFPFQQLGTFYFSK